MMLSFSSFILHPMVGCDTLYPTKHLKYLFRIKSTESSHQHSGEVSLVKELNWHYSRPADGNRPFYKHKCPDFRMRPCDKACLGSQRMKTLRTREGYLIYQSIKTRFFPLLWSFDTDCFCPRLIQIYMNWNTKTVTKSIELEVDFFLNMGPAESIQSNILLDR